MFDSIMRGLRNEPGQWLRSWKRSWKQNARDSILPGALTGLVIGLYVFMGFVMWWSVTGPTFVTILLYLISALIFLTVSLLFWPQLVLFSQTPRQTLVNILLFSAKYLWRVLGAAAVVLFFTAIMVLFAPLSLLLVPVLGFWYILFLAEFIFYEQLNAELGIEETLDRQRDLEAGLALVRLADGVVAHPEKEKTLTAKLRQSFGRELPAPEIVGGDAGAGQLLPDNILAPGQIPVFGIHFHAIMKAAVKVPERDAGQPLMPVLNSYRYL